MRLGIRGLPQPILELPHARFNPLRRCGSFPAISELQISDSYTAAPTGSLTCAANLTRIQRSLQHHHVAAAILILCCPGLDLEIHWNIKVQATPCKPHFCTPGQFRPPRIPATLLRLLVALPGKPGSNSGNPIYSLFASFAFPATASLGFRGNSAEFDRYSKMQAPVSSSSAKAKMGLSNKRYMVITGM